MLGPRNASPTCCTTEWASEEAGGSPGDRATRSENLTLMHRSKFLCYFLLPGLQQMVHINSMFPSKTLQSDNKSAKQMQSFPFTSACLLKNPQTEIRRFICARINVEELRAHVERISCTNQLPLLVHLKSNTHTHTHPRRHALIQMYACKHTLM